MVSYILIVVIAIILSVVVWSYYANKLKELESEEYLNTNVMNINNSLITYSELGKYEIHFVSCNRNSDRTLSVVTPKTPHYLTKTFSGQERIDIGQYRYSQTIV